MPAAVPANAAGVARRRDADRAGQKKTRKKPVPELQLESPATEDPLQSVVAGREEPTRTSVNLTPAADRFGRNTPARLHVLGDVGRQGRPRVLYEANRRLSSEDLIKTYRARPSTAPRPGSRYAYLKKKGSIHTPGRIFHGNHRLRGRPRRGRRRGRPVFLQRPFFFDRESRRWRAAAVDVLSKKTSTPRRRRRGITPPHQPRRRGQKKVLEVNPGRLMFDKAVQDAELEDELLTRHEQRSLGINEKRHIVNLHRTHNYNVANIEAATSHHRDRHCDEYFDYRKEMRRKMIART